MAQFEVSAQDVTVGDVTVKCKRGPFGNLFTVRKAVIEQYQGKGPKELHAIVLCTDDSREPGRLYSVDWSLDGEMIACSTLN